MKLYIAGPMTGLPELNYPAFNQAAADLRAAGYEVLNPAENEIPKYHPTWADWMRLAIKQLIQADAVAYLPGWQRSRGARIELQLASDLDMPRRRLIAWLNEAAIKHEINHPLLGRPIIAQFGDGRHHAGTVTNVKREENGNIEITVDAAPNVGEMIRGKIIQSISRGGQQ